MRTSRTEQRETVVRVQDQLRNSRDSGALRIGTGNWTEAENLVADPGVEPQVAAISHWPAHWVPRTRENLPAARREAEACAQAFVELKDKGDAYWAEQVAIQARKPGMAGVRGTSNLRCACAAADGRGP